MISNPQIPESLNTNKDLAMHEPYQLHKRQDKQDAKGFPVYGPIAPRFSNFHAVTGEKRLEIKRAYLCNRTLTLEEAQAGEIISIDDCHAVKYKLSCLASLKDALLQYGKHHAIISFQTLVSGERIAVAKIKAPNKDL
jgi:hypothetical protein